MNSGQAVLAVVTDRKKVGSSSGTNVSYYVADVVKASDYYLPM